MVCCVFVLTGCTDPGSEPSDASPNPAPAPTSSDGETPAAPSDDATDRTEPPEPVEPPHPVSLPALQQKKYDGARLRLGTEVYTTSTQRQYEVTYRGSGLTISGRIAIPEGDGPFPAIVLAHGYIDPAFYVSGQGMTREREWFAEPRLHRAARRLPQPRGLRRHTHRGGGPPDGLHGGRHQRRARPPRVGRSGRRRADGRRRPVDGRRRRLQRARRTARPRRRRRCLGAGQLRRGRQLRALDRS